MLSRQYDVGCTDPNIEVVDVDLAGDRRLIIHHTVVNGALLQETDLKLVLQNLADLWTYDVTLKEVDASGMVLKEHAAQPRPIVAAAAA
jgi:stage V sporulation protein R